MTDENNNLTEEEKKRLRDQYRFGGLRYSLRSSPRTGPNDVIPEVPGLFTFPRTDAPSED
jgi:hypothetical protein